MNKEFVERRRLVYLSGALRVSTFPEAEAAGPRSHVLGTISGFEQNGWEVARYIVGDKMPKEMLTRGGQQAVGRSIVRRIAADCLRFAAGQINGRRAWQEHGHRADWVYERVSLLQAMGAPFKRRGIPWVLESNGLLSYEAKHERKTLALEQLARFVEFNAYRQCDALVCVTETLKETIREHVNVPAQKIIVVPNGVDTRFFTPATSSRRFFDELTVGYVGGVIPRQGIELLLEAVAELRAESLELKAVIVGDGLSRSKCEALAASLRITEHVKFTGLVSRDDIPRYISGFDIGYSGQLRQQIGKMYHSPLKIYEYMAMGKPVIASDFEDASRLVVPNQTGFLFEGGSKDSLKQCLRRACSTRGELASMGNRARREAEENHSWNARVRYLIDEVEKLLVVK